MTTYRGILNIDFTGMNGNEAERLKNALIQSGWSWVETSAYIVESNNINVVWRGIDLVARQSSFIGQLSALTFHIQSSDNFAGGTPGTAAFHTQAINNILARPFPQP